MLMLMRSEGNDAVVDCDDPVIALACNLDSEDCPAACKSSKDEDNKGEDEVVKSGDLSVTASESAGRRILANGTSDMDTLKFKSSEDVEISKVVLERYGYSTNDSVASVRLENEDGVVISNEVEWLNTKGQANLTIKKDYRSVDGTMNATVVIRANSKAGETIGFKVVDVTSSAKNLNVDNYKPYTYDVVEYSGANLTFTIRNTEKTHNIESGKSYEISKFKVKAPSDSSILVNGFTLTNSGGVSLDKYAKDIEVTVAGEEEKVTWSVNKDDELVIAFKDKVEIEAKANAEFVVKASFSDDFDEYNKSIQLYLDEASDFSATDSKTESRVTVDKAVLWSANATKWPVYKIAGGKVKLTNTKLGNVDASQNSTDVVVAEGKITVPETIKGNLTIKVNGTDTINSQTGIQYMVEAMRLKVGGDEYEGKKQPENYTNGSNLSFLFKNVEIDNDAKVQFLIDVRDVDLFSGKSVTFSIEGKGWSDFYYTEWKADDKIDVAGSISFSKVTFQAAKASLTNTASKAVEFKNGEQSDRQEVFNGVYTAKKGDIKLNSWSLESKSNSKWTGTVNFYLLIDGEEVADLTYDAKNGSSFKKSDTFSDVKIAAGDTAKIVIEADINAKGTGSVGKFTLKLEGEDVNGNKAGNATKDTVELKIVDKGSATVTASSKESKTVLRAASNAKIAEFTIKPSNWASEVEIDDIEFVVKNGSRVLDWDDISVTIDNVTEDAVTSTTQGTVRYEPTNLKAKSEWVTVRVEIEDETYGLITLDNLKVNGKAASSTFRNRYEEAIVKIASIKDLGGTTEFTLDVDADSEVTVKNLSVAFDIDTSSKTDGTLNVVKKGGLDDGDTFEAKWAQNNVRLVDTISYEVYGSSNIKQNNCNSADGCEWKSAGSVSVASGCAAAPAWATTWSKFANPDVAADCEYTTTTAFTPASTIAEDHYVITIKKDEFNDFFKVGSNGYARAYQANK